MAPNDCKWPETEQLGREFLDHTELAREELAAGAEVLSDRAVQGLSIVAAWLEVPCIATVKLDGTNVGVDSDGTLVGRNHTLQPDTWYSGVDAWSLLRDVPAQATRIRDLLAAAVGHLGAAIAGVRLYGELINNGKHDYMQAGIHHTWLCFGALLRLVPAPEPQMQTPEPQGEQALDRCRCCLGAGRVAGLSPCPLCEGEGFCGEGDYPVAVELALRLRACGFNTRPKGNRILVSPNERFFEVLEEVGVPNVVTGYRPRAMSVEEWGRHDGAGSVVRFGSMRSLLTSDWARPFFDPPAGRPLGEGLVVASETDGCLFKWKHAGESLGKVPERLVEALGALKAAEASAQAHLLPPGLVGAFEVLARTATAGPPMVAVGPKTKDKRQVPEDLQARAAWQSTLTKYDCLDAYFARGGMEAKASLEAEMATQVAADLRKDFEVCAKEAEQRAGRLVKTELGRAWGQWLKDRKSSAA